MSRAHLESVRVLVCVEHAGRCARGGGGRRRDGTGRLHEPARERLGPSSRSAGWPAGRPPVRACTHARGCTRTYHVVAFGDGGMECELRLTKVAVPGAEPGFRHQGGEQYSNHSVHTT